MIHHRARLLVLGVSLAVGVGAVFGGFGLLSDAEGLGLEPEWLEGSPFADYRIPGLVLLIVVGGGMLTTAALALRRSRLAGRAALLMGVLLLGWGVVETLTIGYQGTFQLALVAVWVVAPAVPLLVIGWRASVTRGGGRGVFAR